MTMNLTRSAIALAVALATAPFAISTASAQVELRIDRNGPELRVQEDCNPRYEDCRRDRGGYDRDRRDRGGYDRDRREERGCDPGRALRKAERMGLRRARVVDVGRRTIDVAGRDRRGDRAIISFGRRDRSCPVY